MDSLEEFMKRYNAPKEGTAKPSDKQQRDEQKKKAVASVEEYIRRLRQKRRKEK